MAPVVAIAVDYFLVALAVAKTVVDVFEYFVAQVVEVAVEEFDFVVVAAILGLVADLCLLAVDIEHLVVVGFDIAVVAIDLVWAVGLLQIQNRLDSAKAKKTPHKCNQNGHPFQNKILIKQLEHHQA